MPRIPHSTILKAYNKNLLLPLVLRGSRSLPSAVNEFRWIFQHVRDTCLDKSPKLQRQRLLQLCRRRSKGEPLQYILGSQPFGLLDIKCRPKVLIPRPETESYVTYLAELILSNRLDRNLKSNSFPVREDAPELPSLTILDLCTGSGCIPLHLFSLLSSSIERLRIYGWDISQDAVTLAKDNLAHNVRLGLLQMTKETHVEFSQVDIFNEDLYLQELLSELKNHDTATMTVDVIIANPPYISKEAFIKETTRSVRNWEPRLALVPSTISFSEIPAHIDDADIFYHRLLILHSDIFRSRILLMEVGDEAQAVRVTTLALNHYNCTSSKAFRGNNCIEIWRDSPETNELGELFVGAEKILVRGSGNLRAVVLIKSAAELNGV